MGCNFYFLSGTHVGKRSAAGPYCWTCKTTLCKKGESAVHSSDAGGWHEQCPICGKKPKEESLGESSAGRELGFNKQPFKKKTGVSSCSSFGWAVSPDKIRRKFFIKDEYGRKYLIGTFKKMLEACPIQSMRMIGQSFS